MIKNCLLAGLLLSLPFGAGCAFEPLRYVHVVKDISEDTKTNPLIDPNTLPINENKKEYYPQTTIDMKMPCRINLNSSSDYISLIQGEIHKGVVYPVLLDTGCPVTVLLDYNVVRENALPVYPINEQESIGFCGLQFLKLGNATIYPNPSFYIKRSWELQLFGIPLYKSKFIIVGLQSMRMFKYVLFDNFDREVELSATASFAPSQTDQWARYPFEIKNDEHNQLRLFVNISIAGKEYLIPFDTGLPVGLVVNDSFFENHPELLEAVVSKKNSKCRYFQLGWLDCQKVVLSDLNIGHLTIYDAELHVVSSSTDFMLGTYFFKNTVVVLDFERNLIWVKIDNKI